MNCISKMTNLVFSRRFMKFCAVGSSGVLVNLASLFLFADALNIHPNVSAALAIFISVNTNFTVNELWTFRDRRSPGRRSVLVRAVKFNLVSLVGWAINLAVFSLMFNLAGIHYIVSEIIAIGVAMLWNFFVNVKWTWRGKRDDVAADVGTR